MSLSRILHDWGDDKCRIILENVYEALPVGGAVLVGEMVLCGNVTKGPTGAQLQSLNMLVCTEGKERTEEEYRVMLEGVGFRDVSVEITGAYLDAIIAYKR